MLTRGARIVVLGLLAATTLAWPKLGHGAGADDSPATRTGEHRVPFEARDGLIYIHGRVNGSVRTLLIDTGANLTAFTIKAVPTIDVETAVPLNMAKGSVLASRLPVGLVLGDSNPPERHCAFRLNAAVGNFKFGTAEGVVGLDILSQFKSVTFDFKNSVVVLEDR